MYDLLIYWRLRTWEKKRNASSDEPTDEPSRRATWTTVNENPRNVLLGSEKAKPKTTTKKTSRSFLPSETLFWVEQNKAIGAAAAALIDHQHHCGHNYWWWD
jgi:hypothetical protein